MSRKTVSFHVSSATANANSDNTSFSIDLVPELDVGHTAEPTVYLHNLCFVNTFANVSKDLYDNATVSMTLGYNTIEFDLDPGAYSLKDLELAIASKFTASELSALVVMMASEGGIYDANSAGFIDGQASIPDLEEIVYGKIQLEEALRKLHLTDAAPENRPTWDIALSIDEAIAFGSAFPEPRSSDEHKAVISVKDIDSEEEEAAVSDAVVEVHLDNEGIGFDDGTYTDVETATDGSGSGATLDITVEDGKILNVTINQQGSGYATDDKLQPDPNIIGFGLDLAILVDEIGGLTATAPTQPLAKQFNFYIKPITLEADLTRNRVRMMTCDTRLAVDFSKSTLFSKLLGFQAGQALTAVTAPTISYGLASNPARIDKTRAVSFHCPSLASGTYSTTGQMGGSQLAMVPITVGVGEVQSWETSVPIKIPASVAGSVRHKLHFFLSNEDGDTISTLGERFEAVMVLEYDV